MCSLAKNDITGTLDAYGAPHPVFTIFRDSTHYFQSLSPLAEKLLDDILLDRFDHLVRISKELLILRLAITVVIFDL